MSNTPAVETNSGSRAGSEHAATGSLEASASCSSKFQTQFNKELSHQLSSQGPTNAKEAQEENIQGKGKELVEVNNGAFGKFPDEVTLIIFKNLEPAESIPLGLTCKKMYGLHFQLHPKVPLTELVEVNGAPKQVGTLLKEWINTPVTKLVFFPGFTTRKWTWGYLLPAGADPGGVPVYGKFLTMSQYLQHRIKERRGIQLQVSNLDMSMKYQVWKYMEDSVNYRDFFQFFSYWKVQ